MRRERAQGNRDSLTRREFVATSLATGFAAAVLPITAQTAVTTDASGLVAGEVKVPVVGGEMPAYRAHPASGAAAPLVLVVQEIFGVHEYVKDVCRRLAKAGHFAIAPALFWRQGDPATIADPQKIIADVVSRVPDAQVMRDLDAAVDWAATAKAADASKLAITGFCWGGRIVWLYAAHGARLRAGVAWYGRLASPKDELHPEMPIDVASRLKAPVLGLYGGADTGIPLTDVAAMRTALEAAGGPSEIVVYPGAPHGFHADYRPSYREGDASDGWRRMLAWLARFGAA